MDDSTGYARRRKSTRERILTGALRALSRRGIRKVSIEDICHEATVSRRTLYRNFTGREAVLAELVRHIYHDLEADLESAIRARPALEDRVFVVAEVLLMYPIKNEESSRLSASEPDFVRDMLTNHHSEYVLLVRKALAPVFKGQSELRVAGLNEADLAELIVRLAAQVLLAPRLPAFPMAELIARYWRLASGAAARQRTSRGR
jgi:AcrR family transcriptional regulator